ncbi:hypothetical protein HYH02_007219 [Chlamydomonas schloesseri]|uniref:J domain-containing protein n=1 Tax=Chlamydomonas schloesseri TaxID=2026947 RepID=A0A835WHY9_9CHLO|nr:hypothetical protein HYH02_007219 [Chlamydomonas schloesseri]|eukprot:KAG2447761.1 hypothetical protein HYH02_007219 [Chlamydomonas schloesseri]
MDPASVAALAAHILVSRCPLAQLGLNEGASLADARAAFRKLSLTFHPDKCSLPQAAEVFQALKQALSAIEQRQPSQPEPSPADPWAQFFAQAPAPQPAQQPAAQAAARPVASSRAGLWGGAFATAAASTWSRSAFASAATVPAAVPTAAADDAVGGGLQNARRAAELQKTATKPGDARAKPPGHGARGKPDGATMDVFPAARAEPEAQLNKRGRASASPLPEPRRPRKLARSGSDEVEGSPDGKQQARGSPAEQGPPPGRAQAAGIGKGNSTWTRRPVFAPHVWLGGADDARGSGGALGGDAEDTAPSSEGGRNDRQQQARRRRAKQRDGGGTGPNVTWESERSERQQVRGGGAYGPGNSECEGSSDEYGSDGRDSGSQDDSDFELVSEGVSDQEYGGQRATGSLKQKQEQQMPQQQMRPVTVAEPEGTAGPSGSSSAWQGWRRSSGGTWQQRRSLGLGAFGLVAAAEPPAAAPTGAAASAAAPWAGRSVSEPYQGCNGPSYTPPPSSAAPQHRAAPAAAPVTGAHVVTAGTDSGAWPERGGPCEPTQRRGTIAAGDAGAWGVGAAVPANAQQCGAGGEQPGADWTHDVPGGCGRAEGAAGGPQPEAADGHEAGWHDDGIGERGGGGGGEDDACADDVPNLDEELWGGGYGGGEADPEDHPDEAWAVHGQQEHDQAADYGEQAGGGGGGAAAARGKGAAKPAAKKHMSKQTCLPFQQRQPAAQQLRRQQQQRQQQQQHAEEQGAAQEDEEVWSGVDGSGDGGLPEGALDTFLQQVRKDADQQAQRAGQARLTNLRAGFLSFGGRGGARGRGRGRGASKGGGSAGGGPSSKAPRSGGSSARGGGKTGGIGGRGKGGGTSAVGILRFSRAIVPV